jgi:diacylglycerol kinase (ATP)
LGLYLGNDGVEKSLLVGVCFLVLIVEILNSGIEAAIDRIGPEHHELSGLAKDLGSAAVFISLVLVALVWLFVLVF